MNNTFGANNFHYLIDGTLNASLGASSSTSFDAGGYGLSQNTTRVTSSKYFCRRRRFVEKLRSNRHSNR